MTSEKVPGKISRQISENFPISDFSTQDYLVCSSIIAISTIIGIYFMIKDNKFKKRLLKEAASTNRTNLSSDEEEQMKHEIKLVLKNGDQEQEIIPMKSAGSYHGTVSNTDECSIRSKNVTETSSVQMSDLEVIRKRLFDNYHLGDKRLHFLPVSWGWVVKFFRGKKVAFSRIKKLRQTFPLSHFLPNSQFHVSSNHDGLAAGILPLRIYVRLF